MIKEVYCSLEVSKLLKEKGFNEPAHSYYVESEDGKHYPITGITSVSNTDVMPEQCVMPTHQLALAWLREIHKIEISIKPRGIKELNGIYSNIYEINIYLPNKHGIIGKDSEIISLYNHAKDAYTFDTYKEATEAALKFTLENLI